MAYSLRDIDNHGEKGKGLFWARSVVKFSLDRLNKDSDYGFQLALHHVGVASHASRWVVL